MKRIQKDTKAAVINPSKHARAPTGDEHLCGRAGGRRGISSLSENSNSDLSIEMVIHMLHHKQF